MIKFDNQIYGESQFKHRPKNVYFAYAQAITQVFSPKNILDLGCANGYCLEWWHRQGLKVFGVERAPAAFKYMAPAIKPKVQRLDLRKPQSLGQFDLVNCTEVGEHLEPKFASTLINSLAQAAKNWVVLSWSDESASPEHLNPRPPGYIRKLMKSYGLFFEPELTWQLKTQLQQPIFKNWLHWSKNILVFSRTPQKQRVLIRHWQWLPTYANKNLGYFMQACKKQGLGPRWGNRLIGRWHRVWLYPYEKFLLLKLLLLKLQNNKIILKLDSQKIPWWRAQLIKPLVYKIIAETKSVALAFRNTKKLVYFSGGLPLKNINLIKRLKIKRQKIVLYAGRPVRQKGFDRLKKIIPPGYRLKIVNNLPPEPYYRAILSASVVVLPTRGEGWPNVFADAWYCRRLFLTTSGAACGAAILNKTFFCPNSTNGLRQSLIKITKNIDYYYQQYNRLYDPAFFQLTDPVFKALLK